MIRWTALLATLLFVSPLFAIDDADRAPRTDRNRRTVVVVDDVIRMAAAGVSDDAIIAYVRNTRDNFDVTADDIIAMTDAHVSKDVVRAVVDEASARKDRRGTRERSYYAAAPYPYYYSPYYYPAYYDPFWYGPRYSFGFGFGFGPRFGGGFRGRHR
jgi:uncharacterized protein YeeX (DUF496 family)